MDHTVDDPAGVPSDAPADTLTYHQGWDEITELSEREKVVLCVIADICRQTLGMPFEWCATMGLAHRVPTDELRELLIFQGDHAELQAHLLSGTPHLTARERAFGALTADVLHSRLDGDFAVHVDRALTAGGTAACVRAVVGFCGQFGMTKTRRALSAVNSHLSGRGSADAVVA